MYPIGLIFTDGESYFAIGDNGNPEGCWSTSDDPLVGNWLEELFYGDNLYEEDMNDEYSQITSKDFDSEAFLRLIMFLKMKGIQPLLWTHEGVKHWQS